MKTLLNFCLYLRKVCLTTRRYGKTGLDLHIVKSIIEMHNKQIWVESENGVRTTFHTLLPKKCSTR
ncbi:MAG TPA: hypothetical protein C5S51_04340 [Methanosarcinaceae archaeon]|nr:hypothetical protein [Methanosarcinaceae archaeon]